MIEAERNPVTERPQPNEVARLVAELVAALPLDDPASSGDSMSFVRRRWAASRQERIDKLVGELLAKSPPPFAPDPQFRQRLVELVDRIAHEPTANAPRTPARTREPAGAGI